MLSFQHPHATKKVKYSNVYNMCNPATTNDSSPVRDFTAYD